MRSVIKLFILPSLEIFSSYSKPVTSCILSRRSILNPSYPWPRSLALVWFGFFWQNGESWYNSNAKFVESNSWGEAKFLLAIRGEEVKGAKREPGRIWGEREVRQHFYEIIQVSYDPRSYERNLCNSVFRRLKYSGLQRGLNPWPRDTGATLKSTELWSHWRWELVICEIIHLHNIQNFLDFGSAGARRKKAGKSHCSVFRFQVVCSYLYGDDCYLATL